MINSNAPRANRIAAEVETFVRNVVIPYEKDARVGNHGPSDELVAEMREKARAAGVLTPHLLADGAHLRKETAIYLEEVAGSRRSAPRR